MVLSGKNIVLGITGSIAVFKGADLASKLTQEGALVDVVLTKAAMEFITPLTFRALTHRPVVYDLFDPRSELSVEHVELGHRADAVVIAPATANTIAKLASGLADDALSCTVLATKAPVMVVPAMDVQMYENPVTQENLERLKARGFAVVGPAYGRLASGLEGYGRMVEVPEVIEALRQMLGRKGDLVGRKVVVTAGGTQEPIDPVRFISNRSSGKMGYALARAARDRGAEVTLITAPTALPDPWGVKVIKVMRAVEMREAVLKEIRGADALLMAAAVADYQPVTTASAKIKKGPGSFVVELVKTPDILEEVPHTLVKVGFAAESEDLVVNARGKLRKKDLDLIVANDITSPDSGFAADTNRVVLLDRRGLEESLPLLPKEEVAHKILDWLINLWKGGKTAQK